MKFLKKVRHVQDRFRNAGWRIQWIPWWEPGKPEYISPKNPIPLIGVAIFLWALLWNQRPFFSISLSVNQVIVVAFTGLVIAMFGMVLSALQKQAGWVRIDAQCIDREVGECLGDPEGRYPTWGYRLVCVFSYDANEYTVTPEPSHLIGFNSERQVEKYLSERINPDGYCQLWINPKNPLQTVFHKKRW
jgi:hypothetical protein